MSKLPVAVVLCGCGRADGSEIHESVSVLVHLARLGAVARCFAPDRDLVDVVDHVSGRGSAERRNAMVEAARISRGQIEPLERLDAGGHSALIFPGGFGAAKNLCTFARDGAGMSVLPEVERAITGFHALGKPIGLCCIAPVLAAKVLGTRAGGPGVLVTLGPAEGAAPEAVRAWGSRHEPAAASGSVVDRAQRVATSPAYMHDSASPFEVFTGIGAMVEATLGMR
jgi:enhancing lycopene biosynthesis protein 2